MADLDIKVQLRAFDRVSKQFKSIAGVGRKLSQSFDNNRSELAKLNNQLKDVSAFRAQRDELNKSAASLTAMREKMRSLHNQLKNNSGSERTRKQTEALRRQYDAARTSVSKLEEKHRTYQTRLKTVADRLRSAGINTRELSTHETTLKNKADALNNALKTQAARLDKVKTAQQRLNNASQRYANTMSKVRGAQMAGGMATAKGSAAAYGMARLVAPGMTFDKEIDRTAAIARVAKGSDDYNMLRDQAKELGASTAFSASQVAQGQQFLAMAGFTPDAINAAMQDMLNLAAVGDMELKDTADISSNILSAFKLSPEEMGRVADVMSATITRTNTDIRMLGDSMKYVAPAAQSVGASMEETAAMIGLLGNIGIQGEQSGAALRNLYNRLSSPPSEAQKALDALGIAATDAQGNLRELPTLLAEVAEATKDMGSATRLGYFSDIAGLRAGTALSELVDQAGIGQITQFRDVLSDVEGISQRTATAMLDNSYGDWVELKSAIEGFSVAVAEANGGGLRELIKSVTEIVRNITAWVEKNPELAATIGKVAAVLSGLMIIGGGFLLVLTSIIGPLVALQYGLAAVAAIAGVVSAPVLAVIAAVVALAGAAYWLWKNWDNVVGFLGELWEGIKNKIINICRAIKEKWDSLIGGLSYKLSDTGANIKSTLGKISVWFSDTFALLKTDASAGLLKIGEAILNWNPVGLFYKAFANVTDYLSIELPSNFKQYMSDIWRAIVTSIQSWQPLEYMKQKFINVMSYFGIEMPANFTSFMSDIWGAIVNAIQSWQPLEYIKEVFADVIDYFTNYLPNLIKNSISGIFDSVKDAASNIGNGITEGVKSGANYVADGAKNLATGAVDGFKDMLGIHSPSRVFMRLAGFIPDGITKGIEGNESSPVAALQSLSKKLTGVGLGVAMAAPVMAGSVISPTGTNTTNTALMSSGAAQYTININMSGNANADSAQTIAQTVRAEIERIEREREARARSRIYD